MDRVEVDAAAEVVPRLAEQQDDVSRLREPGAQQPTGVLDQPDDADHWRGVDRGAVGLVVERDVSPGDRGAQGAAGVADAANRGDELAHDLGFLGVAEVEAIRRPDRLGSAGGDVAARLGDGKLGSDVRIEPAVAPVAVGRDREGAPRALDPDDGRVAPRPRERVAADRAVVLPVDPALRGDVRRGEQLE